jgi:hypothetical protein
MAPGPDKVTLKVAGNLLEIIRNTKRGADKND